VIERFANTFPKHAIRISTNGTLVTDSVVELAKKHGRMYLAVSLDGHTLSANEYRFGSQKTLDSIMKAIDTLTKNDIAVEILTTIHNKNIAEFSIFLEYLKKNYANAIEKGLLWILPSPIVDYKETETDHAPTKEAIDAFVQTLDTYIEHPLIKITEPYFNELKKYYRGETDRSRCTMYTWAVHIKYPTDSLWNEGSFLLYGCGCRGIKILGRFKLRDSYDPEILVQRMQSPILKDYFENTCALCKHECFNNWHVYDLYLKDQKGKKQLAILSKFL
jgi:sulfatase maturation enzyme AslB (radical SAM superfamily)